MPARYFFCSQKWRKGASLPGPKTPSDYHTKDGGIGKVTGVVNAGRRCWHLDVFETKMAIKAKAQACSSTYLDIGLRHIGRLAEKS
jgi:hypothetical protein